MADNSGLIMLQWGRDVSIPEMWTEPGASAKRFALQWGRDVSIPEIWLRSWLRCGDGTLQWGRDVSIPEIMILSWAAGNPASFNGAGMFLSRKS